MTAEPSVDAVRAALDAYLDPYLQDTLGSAQGSRGARGGRGVHGARRAGFPVGGYQAQLHRSLSAQLAARELPRRSPSTSSPTFALTQCSAT